MRAGVKLYTGILLSSDVLQRYPAYFQNDDVQCTVLCSKTILPRDPLSHTSYRWRLIASVLRTPRGMMVYDKTTQKSALICITCCYYYVVEP